MHGSYRQSVLSSDVWPVARSAERLLIEFICLYDFAVEQD